MIKRAGFLEIICSLGESVKNKTIEYLELGIHAVSLLSLDYLAKKMMERELYEQARREFNGAYLRLN